VGRRDEFFHCTGCGCCLRRHLQGVSLPWCDADCSCWAKARYGGCEPGRPPAWLSGSHQ
jgi:hypothetical protein